MTSEPRRNSANQNHATELGRHKTVIVRFDNDETQTRAK